MNESTPTFLDVERSSTGKRWRLRGDDERLGITLSQRFGLPEIVGRIMAGRGVGLEDAEAFLNPSLRDQMPDPAHLVDMDRAVARIVQALRFVKNRGFCESDIAGHFCVPCVGCVG